MDDKTVANKQALIPFTLVIIGLVSILTAPTANEGPVLLPISEQHSIRLMDAIGLVLAVPNWLYLNIILFRWWSERGDVNED